MAQDLNQYRWENRVIILTSERFDSDSLVKQLNELRFDVNGLNERKIVVIKATPNSWIKGLNNNTKVIGNEVYNKMNGEKEFEFILIGLDGGIKYRKSSIVTINELFRVIDSMPMRKNELRKEDN